MRKIANIPNPIEGICRVMVHQTPGGAFLFLYASQDDGPCAFDEWYASLMVAEREANARFGLRPDDWTVIDEPQTGAADDWIHGRHM